MTQKISIKDSYAHEVKDVISELKSTEKGLTSHESRKRLKFYGRNEIKEKKNFNAIRILFSELNSFLVYILLAAALISYLAHHYSDALVIIVVIVINTIIGFVQEMRAEKSIAALKTLVILKAKVIRDGSLIQIDAKELVPGDVIVLEEGDRVPADARLISTSDFMSVESSITGESLPSEKDTQVVKLNVPVSDRKNMVWMGTTCALGKAKAIVTGTGENTLIGQIAIEIRDTKETTTHFQKITDKLVKQMAVIAVIGSITIFIVGFFFRDFEFTDIFLFSVASLVSAIPEGLPAVLTIVLAIGSYRMSKRKAIVRDLKSTETIGIVNVIATDKTGTLTQNTMTITDISLPNNVEFKVTGEGWGSEGDFIYREKSIKPQEYNTLSKLIEIGFISNNTHIAIDKKDHYNIVGDPTEAAFVVLGEKAGLKEKLRDKIIFDIPFSSDYKYRATLVERKNMNQIFVVGAPEHVLDKCNHYQTENTSRKLDASTRMKLKEEVKELSRKGLRSIGLAYREFDNTSKEITHENVEKLIFVGFVGMKDPARPEVKDAIVQAKKAGIRIIMLTGDHKETALAIAKEIGLVDGDSASFTEEDLQKMDHKEFVKTILTTNIFARLSPKMKLTIAKTLQKHGYTVAMTGDGVNDAPALKQADVGLSMGLIGTDVARDASEIVLADDNFATIVNAVEEGRIVFTNVRRASSFLITTNIAEQVTILGTIILGFPLPLIPTQILWLNLVTDGLSDVALSTENGHGHALNERPKKQSEGILNRQTVFFVIAMSLTMMVVTIIFYIIHLPEGLETARTYAFLCMCYTQLFNTLNMRSFTKSIFQLGIFTNKLVAFAFFGSIFLNAFAVNNSFFQNLFDFKPVSLGYIILILAVSSITLWLGEGFKLFKRYQTLSA